MQALGLLGRASKGARYLLERASIGALYLLIAPAVVFYWLADTIAAGRSDLKPALPPDPVSATRFESDGAAAEALVVALMAAVPDAMEVAPSAEWAGVDAPSGLRTVALSSPRLSAEQILISWADEVPVRSFVWLEFDGLASDPVEWGEGDDLRVFFWTTVGMLRGGIHYHGTRRGGTEAWIHVAEAGGWTRWGVDTILGSFEPRWSKKAPDQA